MPTGSLSRRHAIAGAIGPRGHESSTRRADGPVPTPRALRWGSAPVSRSRSALRGKVYLYLPAQVNGQILVARDNLAFQAGLLQSMTREPAIGELVQKPLLELGDRT